MSNTKINELADFGQSLWLDSISRSMINTGYLKNMIEAGLRGMTSNPTIFDKAISASSDYDDQINKLHGQNKSTFEIYDDLTVRDVQDAADLFRPVYENTGGLDGYVSLEVSPKLAFRTVETIKEGKRLHEKVNRPNVMFKVPATEQGFGAVEELLSGGINVNVTLIFSLEQYIKTADAYLRGLKRLSEKAGDLSKISSVASVFVSRIDTAADRMIDEAIAETDNAGTKKNLHELKGMTAVANSHLIYKSYTDIFLGDEFLTLRDRGANVQRVLWGSTGTKNPDYSDIKYVTELIGKKTVNTLPEKTLEAYIDHGNCREALTADASDSETIVNSLNKYGINLEKICSVLLDEGVIAFEKSFDSLLNTIEKKK